MLRLASDQDAAGLEGTRWRGRSAGTREKRSLLPAWARSVGRVRSVPLGPADGARRSGGCDGRRKTG